MKTQIPTLNPLAVALLNRYLSKVMAAPFISREYNDTLPALITELLRIVGEVEHA